jgi:hypothetical protein
MCTGGAREVKITINVTKAAEKKVPTSILNKLLPLLSILYIDDQMLWGIQI